MANADVIADAGGELEDAVLELMSLVRLCESLDESQGPPWLHLVGTMARRVDEAVQAYIKGVNRDAMPYVRDMQALTKGGMGAPAPMATSGGVPDRPSPQAKANGLAKSLAQVNSNASTRK